MDPHLKPAMASPDIRNKPTMRLRFSLRTFFVTLALVAFACYIWLTRPSQVAQRFADAVNSEDYAAADRLFRRSDDQFLADWADRRWAFKARCELRPLTLVQLLSARREVDVHIDYFEFDYTATRQVWMTATPFGLASPVISSATYGGMLIDEARGAQIRIDRR
jgi:hypothetical protein